METQKTGKLEKIVYDCKYTAGSYADAFISIPIALSRYVCKGAKYALKDKNPEFLDWEKITEKSPTYRTRETLRERLDTEPGMKFIQSNIVALAPFILVGMPAAEGAEALIEKYTPEMGELGKCVANSVCTLGAQMATGYTTFMVNEVRTNKEKYVNENGRLSPKKIAIGFGRAVKAFLSFDVPYCTGKTGLQTYVLFVGKDPWKASGIADSIAAPLWYALCIPLGLHNGVIETEETRKWKAEETPNPQEAECNNDG